MADTEMTVAIVLFVVGGLLIILAVIWLCCFVLRRKRRRKQAQRKNEPIVVYRGSQLPSVSGSTTLQRSGSHITGTSVHGIQVIPTTYIASTGASSRITLSKAEEGASTIPSTTGTRLRGTFPGIKSERKGSKKSKLSSKSSDRLDAGTSNKSRFLRGRRSVNQPPRTLSARNPYGRAQVPVKYATYDGHMRQMSGSTPNLYELRYIPVQEVEKPRKRRRNKPQIFMMEEMPRESRVETWLHRQNGEMFYSSHNSLTEVHRDFSSPPSRASSVPIETSSMSTLDSAVGHALFLRWSPSMKRRSFDSETTGQTATSLQKASDSFTTDTRSFVITPKTKMMANANHVPASTQVVTSAVVTNSNDHNIDPLHTVC